MQVAVTSFQVKSLTRVQAAGVAGSAARGLGDDQGICVHRRWKMEEGGRGRCQVEVDDGFWRLSCNLQKSGKHLRNGPKLLLQGKASSSRKSLFVDAWQGLKPDPQPH